MKERSPLLAWFLGWLLPGAGHVYIGQRARGAVLAGTLVGCFAAGALLGGRGTVTEARPEFLVLQAGAGLPALAAWAAGDPEPADIAVSRRELGILYTLVPALLNLVVALDAAARAAGGSPGGHPLRELLPVPAAVLAAVLPEDSEPAPPEAPADGPLPGEDA